MIIDDKEFAEDLRRSSENFANPGEGFACRNCGEWFVPREGQWVFYNLCDACFGEFDEQKMKGRFSLGLCSYFESSTDWIEANKKTQK